MRRPPCNPLLRSPCLQLAGFLSLEEIAAMLPSLGLAQQTPQQLLQQMDDNRDGRVSFEEV